ncbi:MAG TPA: hypothetical protein VF988_16745 [Verrucomicrobiae bacterium]
MSGDEKRLNTAKACRRARQYQFVGALVLLLGIAGAGTVYWLGERQLDANDPALQGFSRPEQRQMDLLYGKQGRFFEDLTQAARHPRNQAIFIVAVAGAVATGCFGFARILKQEAHAAETSSAE